MKLDAYFRVIEFHSLVGIYTLRGQAMKGKHEKVSTCGQSIWVKSWVGGRKYSVLHPICTQSRFLQKKRGYAEA